MSNLLPEFKYTHLIKTTNIGAILLSTRYFQSDLQRKIPDASRRVLNIRLKEPEEHEPVTKIIYPQVPPKLAYSLMEFGKTLVPVIAALGNG